MYKLLVTDLDGTLLDDYKEIPKQNIKAIEDLHRDFGIIPVIATARPLEVAEYIAEKGGPSFGGYIIATNGALLYDVQSNELLINESLSREQVKKLVDTCKELGLEYEFMTTECEVADAKYSYRRVVDPMYDNMGVPFNYQADLEDYISKINLPIPLFAINGTEEELNECYEQIASVPDIQISGMCIRTTPEKDETGNLKTLAYYDIMKKGVTKASAIEFLQKRLGITREQTIAIGDGGNDIELFREAGLKIAMLNAIPKLKESADIITPVDNNHGGVGVTLDSLYNSLVKRVQDKEEATKEEKGR